MADSIAALPPRYRDVFANAQLFLNQVERESLIGFTQRMFPQYEASRHHKLISQALEDVAQGKIQKLAVCMPPRHGKSELCSVHFPPWFLGNNPDKRIIACSYTASLAYRFSRRARNVLQSPRWPFPNIIPAGDANAVSAWDLAGHRGGYVAAGVGGSITGMGADILLIDDPVRNAQDADSLVIRERNWEWYQSTALTRVEPGGAVVLIGTRWHQDDLIGRAITEDSENWVVLNCPAIAEEGVDDALHREPGQALWPERWSVESLEQQRLAVGERSWGALYQQRPSPLGGSVFHRDWWQTWNTATLPTMESVIVVCDSAFKEGVGSDYSVFATWGRGRDDGRFYLIDIMRGRWQFPELITAGHAAMSAARHRFPNTAPVLVVEDKASGQSAIQVWKRPYIVSSHERLAALPVVPHKISGGESKTARAEGVSGYVRGGMVSIPERAPWLNDWLDEHTAFPQGVHDDMVDTTSIALARLARPKSTTIRGF